ncbi:phosphatase PAP2 family protein [Nocardia camponoti]|uniref:Phosphatase PAP2 family protein n=1 Tax=Nocardia camponoti TaxID=1616106 RepID=A0A917VDF9_9NOCA|nr:phosphatase PAP2 family protein [Nocardia camponoti]GGK65183.1 phosphatase PAP2 family protein [Nocardia camponoti]
MESTSITAGARWLTRVPLGLVAVVALGALSAALADNVVDDDGLTVFDPHLLADVIAHRNGTATWAAEAVSFLGSPTVMALAAAVVIGVMMWLRRWSTALLVALGAAGAAVLVVVGKHLAGRSRPPAVDHLVVETNQSFPSGHALGATVVAGLLAYVAIANFPRLRAPITALAVLFALAVGLSRVYLGVHWPTDVLAGWAIGATWLTLCIVVYRRIASAGLSLRP